MPHHKPVFLRSKPLRLPEDLIGNTELTYVIDEGALDKEVGILIGKTEPCAKHTCNESGIKTMGMGHIILARKHVVKIIQKKLAALGTDRYIALDLEKLVQIDRCPVGHCAHDKALVYGEIDAVSGLEFFETLT